MTAPGSCCASWRMDSMGRDDEVAGAPSGGRASLRVLPGRGTRVAGRRFFGPSTGSERLFGGEIVCFGSASGGRGGSSVPGLAGGMTAESTLGTRIVGRTATGSIPCVSVPGTTNSIAVDS